MNFENFILVLPIILISGLTLYVLYGLLLFIQNSFKNTFEKIASIFQNEKSISDFKEYENFLRYRFPYFDNLPDNLKIKFLSRIKKFISEKIFVGREGLEVTDEMRIWVAASAIQLTFGLENYILSRFSRIILYPDVFYSKINEEMHKGETNVQGIIVLSWRALVEGYSSPSDNFNLGLHEMAHALELTLLLKEDYDSFFGDYYEKWN